ncbi:MAG: hypothetical protein P8Z70_09330 [Desulfuromonadales bacterium]
MLVLSVLLCTGCAGLLSHDRGPIREQLGPLPPGPICRVAVLPFGNDTDFPLAGALFYKVFEAQFQSSGNYQMVQDGDILKIYQQLHLLPGQTPTPQQLQIVANRVKAQVLISGDVLKMQENRGRLGGIDPLLAVNVKIRDGRSAEPLWDTYHRRQGTDYQKVMHFGTIHTVTGLSRQVAVEIINLWHDKGLAQCDALPRS